MNSVGNVVGGCRGRWRLDGLGIGLVAQWEVLLLEL